ncbi:hypothetical protein ACFXB3_11095 [Streptomyces sp. NPDC059447]|uniref:hypothetical protein n=1 Tax=Streptomyces sp. NPDC059447 TaxID=3346834 RepID=UPI00367F8DC6
MTDFNEQIRITTTGAPYALVAKANSTAISGLSKDGYGVEGRAHGTGVAGVSEAWIGVYGETSGGAEGVRGQGKGKCAGVAGLSEGGTGVYAESAGGQGIDAVHGQGKGETCGVAGHSEVGIGIYGKGGLRAGIFDGAVDINGYLRGMNATLGILEVNTVHETGGDYAETFASEDTFEPGTVLVIGNDGLLASCDTQYDTRATGVVSGAGGLNPGSVMESNPGSPHHVTLALAGQVYVKADPRYGVISAGDLLTTSPTQGFAMRVADRGQAVGAILGKAMSSLDGEPGLVRMLVSPA